MIICIMNEDSIDNLINLKISLETIENNPQCNPNYGENIKRQWRYIFLVQNRRRRRHDEIERLEYN